jgi:hypothetical protein
MVFNVTLAQDQFPHGVYDQSIICIIDNLWECFWCSSHPCLGSHVLGLMVSLRRVGFYPHFATPRISFVTGY